MRVNGVYSPIHSLHNDIQHGSPLSVILFSIAFSEIHQIINNCKHLDHCIYADDLWWLKSGAKISSDETKSYIFAVNESVIIISSSLTLIIMQLIM